MIVWLWIAVKRLRAVHTADLGQLAEFAQNIQIAVYRAQTDIGIFFAQRIKNIFCRRVGAAVLHSLQNTAALL